MRKPSERKLRIWRSETRERSTRGRRLRTCGIRTRGWYNPSLAFTPAISGTELAASGHQVIELMHASEGWIQVSCRICLHSRYEISRTDIGMELSVLCSRGRYAQADQQERVPMPLPSSL